MTDHDLSAELAGLTTEDFDPSLASLDTMSTAELAAAMNDGDQLVATAVTQALPQIVGAVDAVTERLRTGGRLFYLGAGTPGRLGVLDASECPPTFGTDPELVQGIIAGGEVAIRMAVEGAEDDQAAAQDDLRHHQLTSQDAVVGISASGRTPYVLAGLQHARSVGALTISLACNENSRITTAADHAIEVIVGPEFIAGSTRLKSGTAQKLVLNMISTLTMIKLGKTYGNVMVDLRATNAKLRVRSERIVARVADVDEASAKQALDEADGSVKVALLSLLAGVTSDVARDRLAANGGYLRAALTEPSD